MVLVLGGNGMLGHKLCQELAHRHEVWATVRCDSAARALTAVHPAERILGNVCVTDRDSIAGSIRRTGAQVVINAVGILNRGPGTADPATLIAVNSLFPHQLAAACSEHSARLIHISTDCVFAGTRGRYRVQDVPDGTDLYGRTKLLGEVVGPQVVTLRTSFIGRELVGSHGLLEWFLSQRGRSVPGYSNAVFSGMTTSVLAQLIDTIVCEHPDLDGLWHASADPINKCDLLQRIEMRTRFGTVVRDDSTVKIDRSLDSTPLYERLSWRAPTWDEQLDCLVADITPYDALRGESAS